MMIKEKTLADKIIFIDNLIDSTFSKKTYLYYCDIINHLNSLQHDKDYFIEESFMLTDILNDLLIWIKLEIDKSNNKDYKLALNNVVDKIKELKGSDTVENNK